MFDKFKCIRGRWPKSWGPEVSDDLLTAARALVGGREGKHVFALALYLRPGYGATDSEVRAAVQRMSATGSPQQPLHNYRRNLEAGGYIKRDMNVSKRDGTVYLVTVTSKGEGVIAKQAKRDAEKVAVATGQPVVKAPRKPKAPKPAGDGASQPQPVVHSEPTAEQPQPTA